MATEQEDKKLAHRLCELPTIFRDVDRAKVSRDINSDADWREWQDCLELFGYALCDTRGVIVYSNKG